MTSDGALFPESDAYQGDPLHPDTDTPTPASIVATLTGHEREARVNRLTAQAHDIYNTALSTHLGERRQVAACVLFSGGNDSTVLAHMFRNIATHAIHANTTIGIEETRQFVRDTCHAWGLPLVEETGPDSYRDLVLGLVTTKAGERVWAGGFPGPGAHGLMYQRLKERALDKARHTIGVANSSKTAAVFIAGRRRQESERRADVPLREADGSVIWASPLALWTKPDLATYRLMHRDTDHPVPVNRVSDLIHMSGECLCGAFAHPGEREELRFWFPDVVAEIEALEADVRAAGVVPDQWAQWGHGLGKPSGSGRLCSSCDARFDAPELFSTTHKEVQT